MANLLDGSRGKNLRSLTFFGSLDMDTHRYMDLRKMKDENLLSNLYDLRESMTFIGRKLRG